jgi:hypothetical protein
MIRSSPALLRPASQRAGLSSRQLPLKLANTGDGRGGGVVATGAGFSDAVVTSGGVSGTGVVDIGAGFSSWDGV